MSDTVKQKETLVSNEKSDCSGRAQFREAAIEQHEILSKRVEDIKKTNSSTAGVKEIRGANALIFLNILILYSVGSDYLMSGFNVYLSRLGKNVSIMLTALATVNLEFITLHIASIIPWISIGVLALVLALIALLRHKNQKAKSTVVVSVVLIVATYLLVLGSPDIL
ncbi:MAG: hypothetical protein JW804_01440 [Sedimentisphaerales bacterium]|nr:hypothetical protein [Sedimentisphaerales bacterium]